MASIINEQVREKNVEEIQLYSHGHTQNDDAFM